MNTREKVMTFINKHQLIAPNDHVLIAVSGGADSMALLHFLIQTAIIPKEQIVVAHVNHGLRKESVDEEQLVADVCQTYGIRFETTQFDIRKLAEQEKAGIEETARKYRYTFFRGLMRKHHCRKLVLAHHADDQMETILMRLVRGSSDLGWLGMQPKRDFASGVLVRPFLPLTKSEIVTLCEEQEVPYLEDATNQEDTYTRNRYRKALLPFLKQENPQVDEQFRRFSEETSEDFMYLNELAEEALPTMTQYSEIDVKLSLIEWKLLPQPLQRRTIHLLLKYLYKNNMSLISAGHVDQILHLNRESNPSGMIHLPNNLIVRRSYEQLEFFYEEVSKKVQDFYHQLYDGDRVTLSDGAQIRIKTKSSVVQTAGLDGIIVNQENIELPLIIRGRMNGDRMKTTGGTRKLKSIFIDAKIPKHKRDTWPIVTDYTGEILWIPGVQASVHQTKPSRETKQYIIRYHRNIGGNKSMHNDIQKVLISEEEIQEKIAELGKELTVEYDGRFPLVIGVLKGATPFMTDLLKRVDTYLEMDFMDVSSYGNGMVSTGEVKIIKDLNTSVEGRDVIILEDIIDSGRTLSYLVDLLKYRKAKSVKLVTLLDKPEGRNVNIDADYVGFVVPNEFVVGYGLDFAEKYRNLPYIGVLKPEIYAD
ncbi:hypoxanthine phosphoribosyltransferase [Listeria weihenstephanensis]|uniref:tRNA(Ile)-lysidine synthase n=1 Tax=Listeria weihenstephanensis TaxID=1006155 RepID=A0A841Z186_9LIST|nr:hypoxanthine phosphoribosyltransferase [Listeria weihenstephanensis]MBC1498975.1 hypoxanthine phosphoribosyltransferase [Listeria weihenstephanensis]